MYIYRLNFQREESKACVSTRKEIALCAWRLVLSCAKCINRCYDFSYLTNNQQIVTGRKIVYYLCGVNILVTRITGMLHVPTGKEETCALDYIEALLSFLQVITLCLLVCNVQQAELKSWPLAGTCMEQTCPFCVLLNPVITIGGSV